MTLRRTEAVTDSDHEHLDVERATGLAVAALRRLELGDDEASRIARHLLDSELRGDRSGGLARILLMAQTKPTAGNARPPSVERETPTTALLNGGGRFGFAAAEDATALAIAKAKQSGVAVVCVNDHTFTGSLSYYLEMVVAQDLVGIATSTLYATPGNARVAPYGSAEPLISTNPLAIGVPTDHGPIICDFSTAALSGGQLAYHIEAGLPLPDGVGLDVTGQPTRDPAAAWAGAVRTWGGHRGSSLAVLLQLACLLCDVDVASDSFGFLIIAVDPRAFGSVETFKQRGTLFSDQVRHATAEEGFDKVQLPFDGSRERRTRASASGVDVPRHIVDSLEAIARGDTGGKAE